MEEFINNENLINNISKNGCLVTIICHSEVCEKVLENLEQTLESCRKISNNVKKSILCNAVYGLKTRISDTFELNSIINSIFFIDGEEEKKAEYKLKKEEIQVLREYDFKNYIYRNDESFPIDELKDIFTNFDFLQIIQLQQQNLKHMKMNRYKQKELMLSKVTNDTQVIEHLERIKKDNNIKDNKIIVYGQSAILNQLKNKNIQYIILKDSNMTREDIWQMNEDEKMRDNLRVLKEKLDGINNEKNVDLYVFGRIKKEIAEHIENYLLKELYIEERKISILKTCVSPEALNFKIIPIRSLEKGDIGSEFIEKYSGLMGIKYF